MPRKNPATGDPILDSLRAERERRHLSQQALAQRIGRQTYQTIWQWESGATEPTLSSLREWANGLGYDIALMPRAQVMPDIPTEALEAAAKADYEAEWRDDCEPPWERLEQVHQDSYRRHAAAIVDAIWLFGVAAGRAQGYEQAIAVLLGSWRQCHT